MSEPLLLRVDHTFTTEDATKNAIDALTTMVNIQHTHNQDGVIMYHFARPDPEKRPTYMEFTEVYADEAVFWSHSLVDQNQFGKAFMSGFPPSSKERSFMYSYGKEISEAVRRACDMLESKYPPTTAGYILKKSEVGRDEEDDHEPVYLKFMMTAAKSEAEKGLANAHVNVDRLSHVLSELSQLDSNKAYTFHISQPEPKTHLDTFEVIVGVSSNRRLCKFLTDINAKALFNEVNEITTKVTCDVYGKISAELKGQLESIDFITVKYKVTATGYILHPKAVP